MPYLFNPPGKFIAFGRVNFRLVYTLLPAIGTLIADAPSSERYQFISLGCGSAFEVQALAIIAKSRQININYTGFDIDRTELSFNKRYLKHRAPAISQDYEQRDLADNPPLTQLKNAHCILWRHPEFLSDHPETPTNLILKMTQIFTHTLAHKSATSPLLITTYDPHEMLLVMNLLRALTGENCLFEMTVDKRAERASMENPVIAANDKDPLFNLNHHDQFQLRILDATLAINPENKSELTAIIASALSKTLGQCGIDETVEAHSPLVNPSTVNLDTIRTAISCLNDSIRSHSKPLEARAHLIGCLETATTVTLSSTV